MPTTIKRCGIVSSVVPGSGGAPPIIIGIKDMKLDKPSQRINAKTPVDLPPNRIRPSLNLYLGSAFLETANAMFVRRLLDKLDQVA